MKGSKISHEETSCKDCWYRTTTIRQPGTAFTAKKITEHKSRAQVQCFFQHSMVPHGDCAVIFF